MGVTDRGGPPPLPTTADAPRIEGVGRLAAGALGAGLAFDLLALRHPPGIGTSLGLLLLPAVIWAAYSAARRPVPRSFVWLAGAAGVLAVSSSVRSSATLVSLNLMLTAVAVAVMIADMRPGPRRQTIMQRLWQLTAALRTAGGHLARVVAAVAGRFVAPGARRKVVPILVGLLAAIPVVAVFTALFASADAVFADYAERLFGFDLWPEGLPGHVVAVGLFASGVVGVWGIAACDDPAPPSPRRLGSWSPSGATTLLALLVVVFAAFVSIQISYLFGGAATLERTGLTYAEYARRGFFELVTVAALVVGMLLVVDWLVHPEDGPRRRTVDALARTLVAFTAVVLASAIRRMLLYTDEFGLTELRLYTTAFLAWTAFLLLLLAGTVLRGDRSRFATGVLASAFVVVAILNASNPDAIVAAVNLDRPATERAFDAEYATSLSADAVPVLVAAAAEGPHRCALLPGLERMRADLETRTTDTDWRSANLSTRRAQAALADHVEAPHDDCP